MMSRPLPPQPLSVAELTAGWAEGPPVVSVLCPTFQHEAFISDAMGGFLAQRTTFPFEVIVRDDASDDDTGRIIAQYGADYPGVVRAVVEPVNRWAELKPLGAMVPMARGEFIAVCEGDDYWTDPNRLQRQVDILRADRGAVLVYHDAVAVRGEQVVRESKLMPGAEDGLTATELLHGGMTPWLTMLYRNIDTVPASDAECLNFDLFLHVRLGRHGYGIIEPGVVGAVQRLHDDSAWFSADPAAKAAALAVTRLRIAEWLDGNGEPEAAAHFRAEPRRKGRLRRALGR